MSVTNTLQHVARIREGGTLQADVTVASTAMEGRLRIARNGNVVTMSCWDESNWQVLRAYTFSGLDPTLYVSLHYTNTSGLGSVRWQGFRQNDPETHEAVARYATSGTCTSQVYDGLNFYNNLYIELPVDCTCR